MNCPKCGQNWPDLAVDALRGGCPNCLLQFAFGVIDDVPDPEAEPETPLTHLGPYTILDTLGRGGMGVVYRARHDSLQRTVALKILNPAFARHKGFPERFQREAQLLAALSHPHIVGVHDLGCESGVYYLAMEYVQGQTLRQVLNRGPLSWDRARPIFVELCDALRYAHEQGVVHRDIKPENVLLEVDGRVKIGDFGVAKLIGDSSAGFTALTETGQVVGTRCYTAPEQLEYGKTVDHRADLYALGVVLYEMLTGELPLGVFPPPSRKAKIDPRIDGIVMRALDREPAKRFASALEFQDHVLRLTPRPFAPKHSETRRRLLRALPMLLLLGVSVPLLLYDWSGAARPEPAPTSSQEKVVPRATEEKKTPIVKEETKPNPRVLTGHSGRVWAAAYSADGKTLATAGDDRMVRLWDPDRGVQTAAFEAYPRGELGYLALAFAPTSARLATAGGGEITIHIWDAVGHKELQVLSGHGREVSALAYSPDGALLASASHDRSVKLWDTTTGKLERTLSGYTDPVLCVAFAPDGTRLAAGAMNGNVKVWNLQTGAEMGQYGHARRVWTAAFAPDGQHLATGSHERIIKIWDLTQKPLRPLVLKDGPEVWSAAFSRDGSLLATGSHDGIIRLWDPKTGELLKRLTGHRGPVVSIAFSPDGRHMATASWDQTAAIWDVKALQEKGWD